MTLNYGTAPRLSLTPRGPAGPAAALASAAEIDAAVNAVKAFSPAEMDASHYGLMRRQLYYDNTELEDTSKQAGVTALARSWTLYGQKNDGSLMAYFMASMWNRGAGSQANVRHKFGSPDRFDYRTGGMFKPDFAYASGLYKLHTRSLLQTEAEDAGDTGRSRFNTDNFDSDDPDFDRVRWLTTGMGIWNDYYLPMGRVDFLPDGKFGSYNPTFTGENNPEVAGGPEYGDQWSEPTGWAYSSGVGMVHTAGPATATAFGQEVNKLPEGETVEVTFTVTGRTAGSCAPRLRYSGGVVDGTPRSTNASFTETLVVTSESMIAVEVEAIANPPATATSDFDGTVTFFTWKCGGWNWSTATNWTHDNTTGRAVKTAGAAGTLKRAMSFIAEQGRYQLRFSVFDLTDQFTIRLSSADGLTQIAPDVVDWDLNAQADAITSDVGDITDENPTPVEGDVQFRYFTIGEAEEDLVTEIWLVGPSACAVKVDWLKNEIPQFAPAVTASPRYGRVGGGQNVVLLATPTGYTRHATWSWRQTRPGETINRAGSFTDPYNRLAILARASYELGGAVDDASFWDALGNFRTVVDDYPYELAFAAYRYLGASVSTTRDGIGLGIVSTEAIWYAIANGAATRAWGLDFLSGAMTFGEDSWVNLNDANRRMYLSGTGAAAAIGAETGPLQVTANLKTPIVVNRTGDDGDGLTIYQDGNNEGGVQVVANTVSIRGYGLAHFTQAADYDPDTLPAGTCISTTEEVCEWRLLEWTDPVMLAPRKEQWSRAHALWKQFGHLGEGDEIEEEVVVEPAQKSAPRLAIGSSAGGPIYEQDFHEEPLFDDRGRQRWEMQPVYDSAGEKVGKQKVMLTRKVFHEEIIPEVRMAIRKRIVVERGEPHPKCSVTTMFGDPCWFGVHMGAEADGDVMHLGGGDLRPFVVGPVERGDLFVTGGHDVGGLLGKPGELIGEVGALVRVDPKWPEAARRELHDRGAVKGWTPFTDARTESRRHLVYSRAS